ncbi:MAG: glycosyltransferase family 1 protein [Proteobacteria bacterium]|nr:glycosyltransferase family 1 protein [Pseudomonadota bacterium]
MNQLPLRVGLGCTALEAGLANNALDGIGHYTQALLQTFRLGSDVVPEPFVFGAANSETADIWDVGSFQRQALKTLLTGAPFQGFAPPDNGRIDLIHATDHFVPKHKSYPVIATLMDVIPLSHPQWVDYRFTRLLNAAWKRSFTWADRIITISAHSKSQIMKYVGVREENIDVVPLGVDEGWFEHRDPELLAAAKQKYSLPPGYLLFVGTLQPRKNLSALIRAHQQLSSNLRQEYPLLIVGRYGWGADNLLAMLKDGADPQIRWLDYVPHEDLQLLMAGATGFVFPSLLEGFGLPILEAFAAGVPVAASNTSSIPEVAGDAALLFDPESDEAIVDAIKRMLEDEDKREALRARGLARAREFSWQRTALRTAEAYRKLL